MNSSELVSLWRLEMGDTASPYLWSDEEVYGYVDDAQTMFCRKTDGIADASTPAVTQIAVVSNTDWVALHPSITRIRTATRADTGREISVVNQEDMPGLGWYFNGAVGPVKALVIGQEADKARVFPKSNETVTLNLSVFRLPLVPITDVGDQTLEVAREHHPHLMLWMKHRGYSKQDAEAFDRTKADEFEKRFFAYCAQVKQEERRKAAKVRVVRYGGL